MEGIPNLLKITPFSDHIENIDLTKYVWFKDPNAPTYLSSDTIRDDIDVPGRNAPGHHLLAWPGCCDNTHLKGYGHALVPTDIRVLEGLFKATQQYTSPKDPYQSEVAWANIVTERDEDGNTTASTPYPYPFINYKTWAAYAYFSADEEPLDGTPLTEGLQVQGTNAITTHLKQTGLLIQFNDYEMEGIYQANTRKIPPKFKGAWALTDKALQFLANEIKLPTGIITSPGLTLTSYNQPTIRRAFSKQQGTLHDFSVMWESCDDADIKIIGSNLLSYGIRNYAAYINEAYPHDD